MLLKGGGREGEIWIGEHGRAVQTDFLLVCGAGRCETEQQGELLRGGVLQWPVRRARKTGVYRKRQGNARKPQRLAKL